MKKTIMKKIQEEIKLLNKKVSEKFGYNDGKYFVGEEISFFSIAKWQGQPAIEFVLGGDEGYLDFIYENENGEIVAVYIDEMRNKKEEKKLSNKEVLYWFDSRAKIVGGADNLKTIELGLFGVLIGKIIGASIGGE